MHRTEILLDDWQYQSLRARAEQEGRNISEIVRESLRGAPAQPAHAKSRLREIEGIDEDTAGYGRDHDRVLYGAKNDGSGNTP